MPEISPTTEFLNEVEQSVREALAALDRDDVLLAQQPVAAPATEKVWALNRLEENLTGWRAILGDMAERVRTSQEDLAGLDADLKRSLDTFAAARKHLQAGA
jgi:hypothetical protein